jgi:hypothetical protein
MIDPESYFKLPSTGGEVVLTEEAKQLIAAGNLHLWVVIGVWFVDWFDNPREEHFVGRWFFQSNGKILDDAKFITERRQPDNEDKKSRLHRLLRWLGASAT